MAHMNSIRMTKLNKSYSDFSLQRLHKETFLAQHSANTPLAPFVPILADPSTKDEFTPVASLIKRRTIAPTERFIGAQQRHQPRRLGRRLLEDIHPDHRAQQHIPSQGRRSSTAAPAIRSRHQQCDKPRATAKRHNQCSRGSSERTEPVQHDAPAHSVL